MNFEKLFQVLVVTGASSTVGLLACSDDPSEDDATGGAGAPGTGGGTNAGGGPSTGGSPGSGGGPSTGGSPGSGGGPSTGGSSGSGGMAGAPGAAGMGTGCMCEPPNQLGWVFCNGTCCWLPNTEPCCN